MLFTVLTGLITSSLLVPFGKIIKTKWSILLPFIPVILFLFYLWHVPVVANGTTITQHQSWVPSLGVNIDFRLDGLSLLFALLITVIGTAIFFYGRSYLTGIIYFDCFFGYLLCFISVILGVVLADNILTLFVFWDLSNISSLFFIGFNDGCKASLNTALTAFSITGIWTYYLFEGWVSAANLA